MRGLYACFSTKISGQKNTNIINIYIINVCSFGKNRNISIYVLIKIIQLLFNSIHLIDIILLLSLCISKLDTYTVSFITVRSPAVSCDPSKDIHTWDVYNITLLLHNKLYTSITYQTNDLCVLYYILLLEHTVL